MVSIELCFRSQNEVLDVTAASTKWPTLVREELLKAIRLFPLSHNDLALLQIERELRTAYDSPFANPANLQSVLESCRQKNVLHETERLFYQHGGDLAILVLGIATRKDKGRATKHDGRWLLREIDALADELKIELAKTTQKYPVTASIKVLRQGYQRRPLGMLFSPGLSHVS